LSRYYWPESTERQLAFFDRFLKGIPNQVDQWPQVRIEVRERYYEGAWRDEEAWPLPGTRYVPYFLDAASQSLSPAPVAAQATLSHDSTRPGQAARFDLLFTEETEITGYALAKLWVSLDNAPDGDLFAALQKIGPDGEVVNFPYFTLQDDGQAAHGWQRISHRELASPEPGQAAPVPGQPVHPHTRELPVSPGQTVDVQVEFWPSSTLFRAGRPCACSSKARTSRPTRPGPSWLAITVCAIPASTRSTLAEPSTPTYVLLPVIPSRPRG